MERLKWLMVLPALMFVAASGFMNYQFAESLGIDEMSIWCWRLVSVGVTMATAGLWHLALANWRAAEYFRCTAAVVFLISALTYDVLAAYGFAHKQNIEVTAKAADAQRRRGDAEAAVKELSVKLEKYQSADPVNIVQQKVQSLTMQLQLIDDTPDLKWKGKVCSREPERAVEIRLCPARAKLSAEIDATRSHLAQSETRERLESALQTARSALNATPLPPAGDVRSALIGNRLTEWLPVILLTLGTTLGLVAIPPSASARLHNPPKIVLPVVSAGSSMPRPHMPPAHQTAALSTPTAYRATRARATAIPSESQSLMIRRLASISIDAPAGLIVSHDGWIYGTQEQLTRAAGFGSKTTFHKALHAAADNGELEIDTSSGRTAIRVLEKA